MTVDSLAKLQSAFHRWRSKKGHVRERVPAELMDRARRSAVVHGVRAVALAAKLDQTRLGQRVAADVKSERKAARRSARSGTGSMAGKARRKAARAPSFSRLEIPVSLGAPRPLAEAETPGGLKLRVFALTPETLGLLSALNGAGRAP